MIILPSPTPITETLDKVVVAPDEYLSTEQPDPDWMRKHGKEYWIQPYDSDTSTS